jgi:hypothetical protein
MQREVRLGLEIVQLFRRFMVIEHHQVIDVQVTDESSSRVGDTQNQVHIVNLL